MQEEDNKNRWPWPLNTGENYCYVMLQLQWLRGENWQLTPLLQGDCLTQCLLKQSQLANDHSFHYEIDVLNYVFFCSTNYSNKEEQLRKH